MSDANVEELEEKNEQGSSLSEPSHRFKCLKVNIESSSVIDSLPVLQAALLCAFTSNWDEYGLGDITFYLNCLQSQGIKHDDPVLKGVWFLPYYVA